MKGKRVISALLSLVFAVSVTSLALAAGENVTSLTELNAAFAAAGEYTLANDIDVTNSGISANVTLDGGNHTLTSQGSASGATIYQNDNVTSELKNLTIQGSAKSDVGIWEGCGTMTLNNTTFTNNTNYDVNIADSATVNINEGTTLSKLRLQSTTAKLNIGANWSGSFEITMDSPSNRTLGTVGAGADI